MFFSKSVLAIAALGLGHAAHACLDARAMISTGQFKNLIFEIYDNGNKTCHVFVRGDETGSVDCGDGYSLDYEDSGVENDIPIVYHAPHGDFDFEIPQSECEWNEECESDAGDECAQCEVEKLELFC